MKNNKAYLAKIHWILLIGIFNGLLLEYISPWLYDQFRLANSLTPYIIINVLFNSTLYGALGIITTKWKEALIACCIAIALALVFYFTPQGLITIRPVLWYFLLPVPTLAFIILQFGWQKKLFAAYLMIMMASLIFTVNFYSRETLVLIMSFLSGKHEYLFSFFKIIFNTASFVFYIIVMAELLNYVQKDKSPARTTLLNLGNEYDTRNSAITFWALKTSLLVIAFGSSIFLKSFMRTTFDYYSREDNTGRFYFLYTGGITLLCMLLAVLFVGWYLRKLLLEYFITYRINSKFSYWLCLIPIIGFLGFLLINSEKGKQERYQDKVDSMGEFAVSSTTAVTVIAFVALFLRLILKMSGAPAAVYLSLTLSSVLFTWMIYDKKGYYFNLGLTIVCVIGIIIASFFVSSYFYEYIGLFFPLLLLGAAQLILIFPVYHFDKFEYIPAENPESGPPKDGGILA